MIKEKPEKSSDTTKDEAGSSDKETASTEVRVKKEDETTVKKEPCAGPITKNGGIVGSTNTGSLQTTLDRKPEIHSEDSLSVPSTDNSSLPLKQEDCIDGELGGDAFGLGLPTTGGSSHPQPPEGVQPLVSNVISKQPNSMEVNYMQQQSQIFVFSTMLANSGADEVLQGRYPSIIAYHCAQPGTKKYLEKNPLKVTQFNRQNPAQWLSNIAMMKNKSCTRSPGLGPKPPTTLVDNFLGPDPLDDMVGLDETNIPWDTKNNHLEGLDAAVSNGLPDVVPDMDACSPSLANVQPSLQGVKVPDENLTPQQRQHREVQLATIRKMQQMLFPESQSIDGVPSGGSAGGGNGPGAGNNGPPDPTIPSGAAAPPGGGQSEWQKLHQFYDDPKRKQGPGPVVPVGPVSGGSTGPNMPVGSGGPTVMPRGVPGPGPRLQGPPPPYHQTPRSASVPIALQSPNPTSPNNPTSNLSLPSPRASSALNSPADPNRPFGLSRHMSTGQSPTSQDSPSAPRLNHSNPSTPLSSHHLSPSVTSSSTEPISTHQSTVDGMFGRTLQSMAQQKQQISTSTTSCATTPTSGVGKEPNLMPVPSPQQIQYLNTFEGQELIIQKQPNTSLKEGNIISPPVIPTTMDSGFPVTTPDLPHSRVSGPNTPTSIDVGPRFPPTPSEGCRFQIPSPHTPTAVTAGDKQPQRLAGAPGLSPQTVPGPNSDPLKTDLFPTPSPHMMDVPRFPGPNASPGAKMGGGFVNLSPQAKPLDMPNYGCVRGDNVPLNPNCTSTMSGNPKVSHFDPISSLAQMSQQLTNSVASSLNGQGNQGPPMMSFGSPSMHMMDMGGCHGMNDMDQGAGGMMGMPMQGPPHGFHPNSPMGPIRSLSPKLSGAFPNHMPMPRMMGRPPGPNPYNGANVQVKPNAPNTIQYLPAKSQVGQAPAPRGPPIVDFLARLATPMNMMESKMQSQNMQYFSSCGPNNGPMQGGPMPPHMGHMEGPMSQDGGMGPMSMSSHMGNGPGPIGGPMGGNMGMPSGMIPMMRGPMRPPMGMRMPQMVFNGPPGGPDPMFNPGPNMGNPSAQMFVSGPKGSPMGMGAPDASQPLPPSMGQNNSFKSSPFVCPTTADPNYAQQFHNFQQQLYATGTRSQMGGQTMGPGPGPPHMQQPPYYNPK
ncbi:protein BCL9 homolog isoform X1 [Diorhabda sublineata]|uniref:protein BCL9 homolog isoform X1 n=1 Tax=Diorhabda sublineata TaxID=1163346 RepID=UPI0024E04958|nr:protein BCL9 homolog isoform X1 [Diorhabda sublineata]